MFAVAKKSLSLLNRPQKIRYLFLLSLRMLTNLLDVAGVAAIGTLAAAGASGFLGQSESNFLGITLNLESSTGLLWIMAAIAGLFVAKAVLSILMLRALVIFLATIEVAAAKEIARHLFSSGLSRMREYSRAEVQWATTSSTTVTFSGVLGTIGVFVTESSLLILMLAFFIVVDPVAAIGITLYFATVIVIFQVAINGSLRSASRQVVKGNVGVTQAILNLFDGFREISVLVKQGYFVSKFEDARSVQAHGDATIRFLGAVPRFFIETALVVGAIGFVAWKLVGGEIVDAVVSVGVFLAGGVRIMAALLPLQGAFAALKSQTEQAALGQTILIDARNSVRSEVSEPVLDTAKSAEIQASQLGLAVSIQNVSYTHSGNQSPSLSGVSLEIAPGGYVALVGPSGAGKTTLADLILGLHTPEKGRVLIEGISAVTLRESVPGLLSYVPQKPGLISGTIAENVALGVPEEQIDRARVQESLGLAELSVLIDSLPEGIDTPLGKHLDSLSGGQVQRLGLARALYTKPRLIILDEATSALDAGAEASISGTILELGQTTTVVVIAHRLSTVQRADEVHVLESGSVIASGKLSKLRKTVPMIQEYIRLMSFDEE